jgi:hypothetical protein
MIIIDKEQVWQDLERQMARTVDGLGKHIDAGTMDVVIAFNSVEERPTLVKWLNSLLQRVLNIPRECCIDIV